MTQPRLVGLTFCFTSIVYTILKYRVLLSCVAFHHDATFSKTNYLLSVFALFFRAQTEDPVDILKAFSHNFLQGRNLDVNNDDIVDIDKNTTALFISRQHLIEDAVSEIHTAINLRWPLEVTFYGEKGEDLGGPRLEFFRLFLQSMKEIFIQNDSLIRIPEHIAQKTYYACGIITG